MNQVEIGKFIAQNRKKQKLTQAQLAERLNITDRAVSKWETGKNMPDASLILELCEVLDITADELLNGEKIDAESFDKKADENLIVPKRKNGNRKINVVISIAFSATLLAGIIVCAICDVAITGNLTWSLIPATSIVFAWLVSFPITILRRKRAFVSLTSLSIFVIPYLYILSELVKVKAVFSIGVKMAIISVVYLWIILAIFYRFSRRKLLATGIMFLLAIPFMLMINIALSKMISEPIVDGWDVLSAFVLLIAASVSFVCDFTKSKEWIK